MKKGRQTKSRKYQNNGNNSCQWNVCFCRSCIELCHSTCASPHAIFNSMPTNNYKLYPKFLIFLHHMMIYKCTHQVSYHYDYLLIAFLHRSDISIALKTVYITFEMAEKWKHKFLHELQSAVYKSFTHNFQNEKWICDNTVYIVAHYNTVRLVLSQVWVRMYSKWYFIELVQYCN